MGSKGRLLVALVLHVLLDDLQRRATDCGHEIGVGSQGREAPLEAGELFAQEPGRAAFDLLDQAVDSVLGVALDQ